MRRSFILLLVVTALVLGLGVLCEVGNQRVAQKYQKAMLEVGVALGEGRWKRAEEMTMAISGAWARESGWVQLWVNHADTDNVTQALRGLMSAISLQDEMNALLYYGDCLENFGHLHHRDAFTLKNIL